MSLAEIREQIAALSVEERVGLAALIAHLNRTDDVEFQSALDRRVVDMDAGKKTTLDQLEQRHRTLSASGK